jgi:two-component system phosphate regulon sensor histidine kinase PhoR
MSYQFAVVNLLVVVGMFLITIVIVKKVLSPISMLKENSALIAGGVYDKRIVVSGQDEVAELAENFNQMAEAVMRTVTELHGEVDRRTLFMSAITHELKTPLTSIKGNAQTLLATKMDEEEREDALLRINDACTHMEHLSQKLTQLIVMRQSGDIALTLGSVSELLSGVEKSCSERLKNAGISLIIENHMDVLPMDCDLLSSLLTNLVDNAAKASLPGGNIILRAEAGIISVKDTGKGIPKDELPKITQPFYMVDKSRAKKTGGMGLGLAICEEIARLHGARLVFESEVDNGTTAKVVFNYEKTVGIP